MKKNNQITIASLLLILGAISAMTSCQKKNDEFNTFTQKDVKSHPIHVNPDSIPVIPNDQKQVEILREERVDPYVLSYQPGDKFISKDLYKINPKLKNGDTYKITYLSSQYITVDHDSIQIANNAPFNTHIPLTIAIISSKGTKVLKSDDFYINLPENKVFKIYSQIAMDNFFAAKFVVCNQEIQMSYMTHTDVQPTYPYLRKIKEFCTGHEGNPYKLIQNVQEVGKLNITLSSRSVHYLSSLTNLKRVGKLIISNGRLDDLAKISLPSLEHIQRFNIEIAVRPSSIDLDFGTLYPRVSKEEWSKTYANQFKFQGKFKSITLPSVQSYDCFEFSSGTVEKPLEVNTKHIGYLDISKLENITFPTLEYIGYKDDEHAAILQGISLSMLHGDINFFKIFPHLKHFYSSKVNEVDQRHLSFSLLNLIDNTPLKLLKNDLLTIINSLTKDDQFDTCVRIDNGNKEENQMMIDSNHLKAYLESI